MNDHVGRVLAVAAFVLNGGVTAWHWSLNRREKRLAARVLRSRP